MIKVVHIATACVLAFSACVLCGAARAEAEHQPAVWKEQKAHFDYIGFTTRYSCQGLDDKIRQVLHELGARKGFKVTPLGCDRDNPVPLPAVDIVLATLKRSETPEAIDTVWKKVNLGGMSGLQGDDCELAEQIVKKILPLFEIRNVHMNTTCTPNQMPTGPFSLTIEVLSPVAPL